jgi:hypothetical protein
LDARAKLKLEFEKASGIDKAIGDSICVKICYDIRICRVIVFSYTGKKTNTIRKKQKV